MTSFKYAVVINGSADKCYLDRVTSALTALKDGGYTTYVVSPARPDVTHDNYFGTSGPKMEDVRRVADLLNETIDEDDELVIYTTGKGTNETNIPRMCLGENCDFVNFAKLINGIKHGRRTIVMEQSYGGLWRNIFTDNPSQRFFAVSVENEPDCGRFGEAFWAKDVTDRDGDGEINWEERYAHGMAKHYDTKLEKARQIGKIYARVQALNNVALGQAQAGLETETAVTIGESISNAVTMDDLFIRAEVFGLIAETIADALLPKDMGLALFKRLLDESKKFRNDKEAHVTALSPLAAGMAKAGFKDEAAHIFGNSITIAVSSGGDESDKAGYLKTIADSIARSQIEILDGLRLLDRIAKHAEKIRIPSLRADVFSATAFALAKKDQKDKAAEYYEKALVATRQVSDNKLRAFTRKETAKSLAKAGFREKAWEVMEPILLKDGQIEDPREKALALNSDAFLLADMGFLEKAVDTFDNAVKAAEGIEDSAQSFDTTRNIAYAVSSAGFRIEAKKIYNTLIEKTNNEGDAWSKSRNLQGLVSSIVLAKLGSVLTMELFEKILPTAAGITDEEYRSQALLAAASNMARSDMGRFRISDLLELTAAYIDRFEDNNVRRRTVREMETIFEKAGIFDHYSGEYKLAISDAAKMKDPDKQVDEVRKVAYAIALSDKIGNSAKHALLDKLVAAVEGIKDEHFRTKALHEIEVVLTTTSLALYIDGMKSPDKPQGDPISKAKAQALMDRLVRAVKTLKNRDRELKRHIIPFMQALCLKMDGI